MNRVVDFTLRQKVVINLLFVLLIVIGAFIVFLLPIDRYPNIQFGKMYINTFLPGASPEEVETLVTREIEDGLERLEDIDYIRSSSYRERSNIVIKFADDSDYRKLFDDVRIKVLSITKDLPPGADPPVFNLLDVGDWFPAISVNVSGRQSNTTLKLVAEELKIPLSAIPGVQEVKLLGAYTPEFHLLLDQEKLSQRGLTFSQVATALARANLTLPAGHGLTPEGEFSLRVDEQFTTRDQLLETIIRTDGDGSFTRVADVTGDALHSHRDPFIIASVNGRECVTLQILKSEQGNSLAIAAGVRQLVERLAPLYAREEITLSVSQDSSKNIRDSIRVLGVNLLVGIVLVCWLIWAFMGFRNAALTTIGIPFAFLVTLILMYLTGNSINEVSLFAFVLVSGIIVDDAIVVVENIYRHIQEGRPLEMAIVTGTSEVFLPVLSATLTTVAAFLPMLLMTGMVGDFFAIIPKTIVFALLASLLECLLILPCHYLEFGRRRASSGAGEQHRPERRHGDGRIMAGLRSVFNRAIRLALRFRLSCQALLLVAFGLALLIFVLSFQGKSKLLRIQFFPDNYSLYYVELFGPAGTSMETTNQTILELSRIIHDQGPGMAESALGFSGYYIDEDFTPQYGNTLGHIAVTLPPSEQRRLSDYPENDVVRHLEYMRSLLAPHLPADFTMVVRPEKDGPPTGKDLTIRVLGTSEAGVAALAASLSTFLTSNPDTGPLLRDVKNDQGKVNRVFRIRLLKERVAEWGLDPGEVVALAAATLNGRLVGRMRLPEEQVDLIVKMARPREVDLLQLLDTPVIEHPRGMIRLGDLCTLEFSREPGILNRFQQQRAITLTANLKPGASLSAAAVVAMTRDYYQTIRSAFPGATLIFAGEHESTRQSFISLSHAFIVATLVIYLILAAQFQSYLQPLIIITAIVFALIGVIFGTFFSRTLFTINSFVAVIGVTGVVVNDSLVLVAFLNRCYQSGMSRQQAIITATNTRLRPILLTTFTTTLGLLPMALGIPEYSIVWGSMAMTFVTGLCSATLLTIIIIPVQWEMVTKSFDRQKKIP
ncbi:efflux RND transporter permease subunit [Desulfogranum mediterraneum]|uniref:efflux RND transporter permease subunit n=1 Tax=Desulfogranum mediterraneum TaxID=160661 RepID=UPI00042226BE|nr:efflux RND transporter permease subunit [Desulfogranum mediterraneum]